jgi:hypothetical protein
MNSQHSVVMFSRLIEYIYIIVLCVSKLHSLICVCPSKGSETGSFRAQGCILQTQIISGVYSRPYCIHSHEDRREV